ncbi:MAG: 4Fe-4S binding protein [Bacteroidales bacterium]|jgi:formate dehydrogenase iron-sulfur subunit|nr:4Fe-4S binding protein [Bacteroidales bacterium]
MEQKILIDMIKIRAALVDNPAFALPDGYFYPSANKNGLKSIRELAIFSYTCRKCEDAPCISVCPADALEKDEAGLITRHTNLCVSCKSCVTICPFGTMMTDFFRHHRNRDLFCDLKDEKDVKKFIDACPEGTVTLTDENESPEKHIYSLNEKVLVKEYLYITETK